MDATPKVSVLVVAPKTPKEPPPMQFAPFEEIMDKLIYLAVTEDGGCLVSVFFVMLGLIGWMCHQTRRSWNTFSRLIDDLLRHEMSYLEFKSGCSSLVLTKVIS